MPFQFSENVWNTLACPHCSGPVEQTKTGAFCPTCDTGYGYTETGALDLRLKEHKKYVLEFMLNEPLLPESGFNFRPLSPNPKPEVDFSSLGVPHHLTKELMSYIPKAKGRESLILDLGCGSAVHRELCEHAGFEYVGLDYDTEQAPILGDAHSLPFRDESFESILSISVLEHIRYPFVMMREAYRVLKPNGSFIGTVAFLEPFHGDSFYHNTHLGVYNSLQFAGFRIVRVSPNKKWPGLVAQARQALFPKMPKIFAKSIVLPVLALHRLWWWAGRLITGRDTEDMRVRNTTGSFAFVATKD
ncbi:MAG: class I SAM-dependent methyltransferase [Candidatus Aminicenantes bacterium]|nr:MAG: class I SAM-dependent methyltransferase [Candidatus Aminicenantes bacterium]